MDATDQTVLATLTDGIAVELDDPANGDYAIRVNVEDGSAIGSVHLALTGAKNHSQTESVAPYSLYGDGGANALTGESLPVGSYELEATAYSQGQGGGDELGTLSVSFTVTETAPTPTPTPTPEPDPLTAAFQDMPEGHNGTDTFSFQILFSEAVNTSYRTLEDSALTVPNGEVTSASRVDGRSDLWQIVVRPDSDADVTLTLPATEDCTANGAVCTEGGKKLSAEVSHTVPGPEPEEASTGPLTGFALVDASDQTELATLTDGAVVELDDPAGGDYAIRVNVEDGSAIGSVYLALTGAKSESRTENVAPYSLYGDGGANALTGGTLPVGSYELEATAYSEGQGGGDELGTLSVSFTVAAHTPTPVPPALSASALDDGSGVVLSWNRPAEDADSVTGYEILRALGSCRMTTLVADTENQRVAYLDEDATIPGQPYAYQVKTIMGEQRSAASNRVEVQLAEATTTAEQDASSPVPPTLCAWALHDGSGIVLNWSRPAENADSVTGYEILRALDDGEMTTLVADTQSKSVAYIDEATESGKTHAYQVKTIMGEQKSEASNRAEVHIPHDPVDLAPSNLVAETADEGVALTWNAPAEVADAVTGYEILRAVGDGGMTTLAADTQSTDLAYTDEEATEGGETYAYQMKAIRGEEKSQASNRAEAQVPHDPVDLAPSNLEAVAIQGGVGLDWDAPDADTESVTGYQILRSASPEVVLVEDTKSDVTEFIDDTAEGGMAYTYRVKAIRDGSKSEGANSNTVVFVDDDPPVALPQVSAPEMLLVKNTNPRTANAGILTQANDRVAQAFTTGAHTDGYRLTSIGAVASSISQPSPAANQLTATINQNGGTNPGAVLCTLVNPTFTSVGLQTFTAPADCPTLNPRTAYFFVIERTSGSQHISWESNVHNDEDPGGLGDWSIADGRRHLFSGSWSGDNFSHLIEIRGSLEPPALVKNTGLSGTFTLSLAANTKIAQAFTTGAHTAGYRLNSIGAVAVQIADTATAGSELTATLNAASGSNPGAVLCTLTDPPAFTSSGIQTFTVPADCPTLRAKRTYFLVTERTSGTTNVLWAADPDDAEDPGRARDWSIANGYRQLDPGPNWDQSAFSLLIEVKGPKVVGRLVKNTGQSDDDKDTLDTDVPKHAQQFTTGPDAGGYTLGSVGISFDEITDTSTAGSELTVSVRELYDDPPDPVIGPRPSDSVLCRLRDPQTYAASGVNYYWALPHGCPLKPNTTYFVVIARANNITDTISLDTTNSPSEDSGAAPGWSIDDRQLVVAGKWVRQLSRSLMIEIRAPIITQLLWSGEIEPGCSPYFGCGYAGNEGGKLTNSQFTQSGTTYTVEQLTWWADDDSGYVKLVMTANNEDKNREAATAGKFPDFDYLRVAWGEPARDDPYHPDLKFGPDETLANPYPGFPHGRYDSLGNDVTFVWKMSKSAYQNRGLKFAGNHYPIYVQLRK